MTGRVASLFHLHALKPKVRQEIRERTGLVTDAYFSGTKVKWILTMYREQEKKQSEASCSLGTLTPS